jgi:hypothetical protein
MDKAGELKSKLHQSLYGSKDEVKNLSLMKKLNPANKNLAIGMTLVEGTTNFPMGLNTGVFSMMNDASKIKRKIVLPKDSNFNYTGLLIGPKGNNQKQLEEKTGCKILVRGKSEPDWGLRGRGGPARARAGGRRGSGCQSLCGDRKNYLLG